MGYLDPARGCRNLTIRPCCHVERLLLERGRAAGVTVRDPEGTEAVYGAELLLCCGAIGTPHLLLRSGIGPADHLREVWMRTATGRRSCRGRECRRCRGWLLTRGHPRRWGERDARLVA